LPSGKNQPRLEIAANSVSLTGPTASAVVCYALGSSIVVSGVSKNELITSISDRLHDKDDNLSFLSLTARGRAKFPSSRSTP
jgi:hypothetical protein